MSDIFQEEALYLDNATKNIQRMIEENEKKLYDQKHTVIGTKEAQRGAHFTREALMSMYATTSNKLKKIITNPYFGRFDFKMEYERNPMKIYVGKAHVEDVSGANLVYDWRSPICSLYYQNGFGKKSYIAPSGEMFGDVSLRRQIKIQNGKLINVAEASGLSSDEFLIPFLKTNADSRLKDIVSSIQQEQNGIIRDKLNDNIIVQGVAGSGKTTVALHRISYLLYTYKNLKDNQVLVIGPNKYFMNYISDVLPDLDVERVSQKTFIELIEELINSNIKLEEQSITIESVMSSKSNPNHLKFKSSLYYEKLLEDFLHEYFLNLYQEDCIFEGIKLVSKEKANNFLDYNNGFFNVYDRIKYLSQIIIKDIKETKSDKRHSIWLKYAPEYKKLEKDDPRRKEILDYLDRVNAEIDKGCASQVKEYLKLKELNPYSIYMKFLEYLKSIDSEKYSQLVDESFEYLKRKKIRYEDMAALLYISTKLYNTKSFEDYSHIVMDEAQDYGLFHFDILKKIFKNSTFSIFGDLNQSIHSYSSIDSWEEVIENIFDNKCKYGELNKSYRTTKEIIDLSNFILEELEYQNADAVLRHGDLPLFIDSGKNVVSNILGAIDELKNGGIESIAVITKTEKEAKNLFDKIKKSNDDIKIITSKDEKYDSGICLIPSYLSKGLEFDAVILSDASYEKYNSDLDLKLLYVATTRPLHKIVICYNGKLTKPFDNYQKKLKIK